MESINQQPSSQQSEKPHKPLTLSEPLKIFIFLILVLLLVGFSIVSYKLGTAKNQTASQNNQTTISPTIIQPSPTPAPLVMPTVDPSVTANWKTYLDTKKGFTFKYPPDWKIKYEKYGFSISSPDFIQNTQNQSVVEANQGAQLFVANEVFGSLVDVKEGQIFDVGPSRDKEFSGLPSVSVKHTNVQKLTIDEGDAILTDFDGTQNPKVMGTGIQIVKNGNGYGLSLTYTTRSYKTIFYQILSTFRFD